MKKALGILVMLLASCASYTAKSFQYRVNGSAYTVPLQVPKGYTHTKTEADSTGNTVQYYYYGNGAVLYAAYAADSTGLRTIDTSRQVALPHPSGGIIYKGMNPDGLFWREIRLKNGLIYGYKDVPTPQEVDFDRAVDFSSLKDVR